MGCNCENTNQIVRPVLKHTQGNYLQISIPIKLRWHAVNDGTEEIMEQGSLSESNVVIELSRGKKVYTYTPEVYNNQLVIIDRGKLPIGTYNITIVIEEDGFHFRYKQRTLLMIVDETASGGEYANDEVNILAIYPVVEGNITAISFGDGKAIIRENGKFKGDDTPNNGKAEVTAVYGDGHLIFENGEAKIIL